MLEQAVERLYLKFRVYHCSQLLSALQEDGQLSAAEANSLEVIYLLGSPTIKEFAAQIDVSQPNATYRVNKLIEKGYLIKLPSPTDGREFILQVTEKFSGRYGLNASYIRSMLKNIHKCFSQVEIEQLEEFINRIVNQAME